MDYKLIFKVRRGKPQLVDIVFAIPPVNLPELKAPNTFWSNKNDKRKRRR